MDIRRFFDCPSAKNVAAGSSKKPENGAKSKRSSEKSKKPKRLEKGNDKQKRKKSKISESDHDEPAKEIKKRKHSKRNKAALDSDSSGEEPLPAKLRKTSHESKKDSAVAVISSDEEDALPARLAKKKDPSTAGGKELSIVKKSPAKVLTNVSEYFGSKPVERFSSKIHAVKRKERSEEGGTPHKDNDVINIENDVKNERTSESLSTDKEIPPEQPFKKVKKGPIDTKPPNSPSPSKEKLVKHSKGKQTARSTERTTSSALSTTPVAATPEKSAAKMDEAEVVPSSLERKSSAYRSFMMREPPQALGSKEIPKGTDNCLEGLVFVVTGVLESIERDDVQDLIKRHGGKVTQSVSKKTSYMVVGRDAGDSKLEKAKQLGTKQIDEERLFDIIRSSVESSKATDVPKTSTKKEKDSPPKVETPSRTPKNESQTSVDQSPSQGHSQTSTLSSSCSTPATQTPSSSPLAKGVDAESLLWVDKYSPKCIKQIIGQQGEKSNVKKLLRWLQNWHSNRKRGKAKGGFIAGKDDGSIFKAALLSGPPGVGKTTSAHLVCKESGFSFIEFNASDSRSKKTLEEQVSEVLGNKAIDGYLLSGGPKCSTEKHVLVMDEVDGMAGNEDRGGMQELINLIKSTKIPMICMCNDRNSQKVRSLSNYCFDLRFQRPRVEQIKGAMMSIAFKEKLSILPQAMEKVIIGSNQDVRQVLHNLSMWTSKKKSMNYDEAKADAERAKKDIKMGPFDVTRKLFSAAESSKMSMQDYFSLFFNDYSLIPLFSQENYIQAVPYSAGGDAKKILKCVSDAAESFCESDLVDKCIRSNGSWNLLPLQSFFSCVLPGKIMNGRMGQKIDFPSWLGKNSTTSKNSRILQDLLSHTQLSTSGSKLELNMDYVPHLRRVLTRPLIHANSENCTSMVSEVIEVMDSYHLMKEDWDSILEVGQFEGKAKLQSSIDSKVKAAFTRAYNKECHLAPYSSQTTKKKRGKAATEADENEGGEEEAESGEDDIEHNSMIKVKKPTKAGSSGRGKKGKTNQTTSSGSNQSKASRGKGSGKGKGKAK